MIENQNGKRTNFINLSNHPSSGWSAEQTNAAQKYGKIKDLKFPNVPSDAVGSEIEVIVMETFAKVMSEQPAAVMCAGEPVVCFKLVELFKIAGVTVLAAVTDRVSEEIQNPDGTTTKVSKFCFKGFREF